jgi:hypothetical protein
MVVVAAASAQRHINHERSDLAAAACLVDPFQSTTKPAGANTPGVAGKCQPRYPSI